MNDRGKVKLASSQLGFLDFLAQPMWEAWQDFIGDKDSVYLRVCWDRHPLPARKTHTHTHTHTHRERERKRERERACVCEVVWWEV